MISCVVLNWNETEIAKDSVRLLLREGHEVVLVDNGSTDGAKEYFKTVDSPNFKFVDLPSNMGASVGRNKGLEQVTGDYIFLIDGDILYVKGTIDEYKKILEKYTDAFCVGQNSTELLAKTGYNGVYNPVDADFKMSKEYILKDGFPMAWTQYGLFRKELKDIKFVEDGVFGQAGYGFEDDWLFHDIKSIGMTSLSVDKPLYYHQAHGGWRELNKAGLEDNMLIRKDIFESKWGKKSGWGDTLKKGVTFTTLDNPS